MELQANQVNQANTRVLTSRPADSQCLECGAVTRPFLTPALLDFDERWIPPARLCSPCIEEDERKTRLRSEQQRLALAFSESMMSPRFRDRTFANFEVTEANRKAWEAAKGFRTTPEGHGLLFYGSFGIGKTHLAAAIANENIGKVGVVYISCPDLLAELRASMNNPKKVTQFESAKRVQLLVLDDIGAERPSEWVQETLFLLINSRYEYKLPTIFTTNCSLDELEEKLGGRITSRIVEMTRCIQFGGEDRRLAKFKSQRKAS